MVFLVPCRLIVAEEGEQPAAAQFGACCFHQKGAPATRANNRIDFFDQFLR
jgi:hypothetical protein